MIKNLLLIAAVALVSGCAGMPAETGRAAVERDIGQRLDARVHWRLGGDADAEADRHVRELLAQTLSMEAAVQVALLNHRGLQAEYENLGVAQADVVQAGLLRNPSFGWSRLEGGGFTKTNWGLEFDFIGLLLAGPRQHFEAMRFEHARLGVTEAVLNHVTATRNAWVEAVAARQSLDFAAQVKDLAEAEAELGRRQLKAGNVNRRDALRQQAFALETALEYDRATLAVNATREKLSRLLGLGPEQQDWQLPAHLPALPAKLPDYAGLDDTGVAQRLDVQMAQKEAEGLAAALKITRDSRFIRILDVGVETEKSTGEKRITGPTLKLELPVFDRGQAEVSRQEALYRQSEARLYEAAVNARSEIREALHRLQSAHGAARRSRDALVPIYRSILEESTLHHNGMLIGVYDLLADARAQVAAVQGGIAAERDFWSALAELQKAVGGKLPGRVGADEAAEKPVNHGEHEEHGEKP